MEVQDRECEIRRAPQVQKKLQKSAKTYKKSRKTIYKIRRIEVQDKRKISSKTRFTPSAFLVLQYFKKALVFGKKARNLAFHFHSLKKLLCIYAKHGSDF